MIKDKITIERGSPVLQAGSYYAILADVGTAMLEAPFWEGEQLRITFRYEVTQANGEIATVKRNVKPSLHVKASLYKDIMGMAGAMPNFNTDEDIIRWLNTQIGKQFSIVVTNKTTAQGDTRHYFASVSLPPQIPASHQQPAQVQQGKAPEPIADTINEMPF